MPVTHKYGKKRAYEEVEFKDGDWPKLLRLGKTAVRDICRNHGRQPARSASKADIQDVLKVHLEETHGWENFAESDEESD